MHEKNVVKIGLNIFGDGPFESESAFDDYIDECVDALQTEFPNAKIKIDGQFDCGGVTRPMYIEYDPDPEESGYIQGGESCCYGADEHTVDTIHEIIQKVFENFGEQSTMNTYRALIDNGEGGETTITAASMDDAWSQAMKWAMSGDWDVHDNDADRPTLRVYCGDGDERIESFRP